MKLSAIAVDAAAIEEGVWIPEAGEPDLPRLPGIRFRVRGPSSVTVSRAAIGIRAALGIADGATLTDEQREKLWTETLARVILVDWSGLEDDAGANLAFSADLASAKLADPNYRIFKAGISAAAIMADSIAPSAEKTIAKN